MKGKSAGISGDYPAGGLNNPEYSGWRATRLTLIDTIDGQNTSEEMKSDRKIIFGQKMKQGKEFGIVKGVGDARENCEK
jgi:hypothetical protein